MMKSCLRMMPVLGLSATIMSGWGSTAQGQGAGAVPEPGETFRDCPACSEMVVVPPGTFSMGAPDAVYEKPEHRVTIANALPSAAVR